MPAGRPKEFKPINKKELSKDRAAEMGRKSGEARRKKKDMRESMQEILNMSVYLLGDEIVRAIQYKSKKANVQEAILMGQVIKAITDKDTKAAEFVRDTSGQKPTDKHELEGHISYEQALNKVKGEEM